MLKGSPLSANKLSINEYFFTALFFLPPIDWFYFGISFVEIQKYMKQKNGD